jgi:hypothetical protein
MGEKASTCENKAGSGYYTLLTKKFMSGISHRRSMPPFRVSKLSYHYTKKYLRIAKRRRGHETPEF